MPINNSYTDENGVKHIRYIVVCQFCNDEEAIFTIELTSENGEVKTIYPCQLCHDKLLAVDFELCYFCKSIASLSETSEVLKNENGYCCEKHFNNIVNVTGHDAEPCWDCGYLFDKLIHFDTGNGYSLEMCETCLEKREAKKLFGMCHFCNHGAVAFAGNAKASTPVCSECAGMLNHNLKITGNPKMCFCAMCGYPAALTNTGEIAKSANTYPYSACEGCFDGSKQPLTPFEQAYFGHITVEQAESMRG